VRGGDVVGLAGLGGCGRTTVCRTLVGLGQIRSGEILYLGQPAQRSPDRAAKAGMVLIPEDRKTHGLILNQSMRFNMALPNLFQINRLGVLHRRKERAIVERAINDIQIRPANPELTAETLSGGNQQKIVVGKWLHITPKLVIFDEPTRGIDVGAKAEIHTIITKLACEGKSIIMVSSEMPEILGMSDRVLVMSRGQITAILDRKDADQETIMRYASAKANNNKVA